jgi:Zn-dependent peptidase ImmA (M78 family)
MKKTNLKGIEYTIIYVADDDPSLEGDWGSCSVDDKIIRINKKAKGKELFKTLVHEELHALLHEGGIRDLDKHFEHVIIEVICDYITDNFQRSKHGARRRR